MEQQIVLTSMNPIFTTNYKNEHKQASNSCPISPEPHTHYNKTGQMAELDPSYENKR